MSKSTIQYNLTQDEATIIEDIRAMVSKNKVSQKGEQLRYEMIHRCMALDEEKYQIIANLTRQEFSELIKLVVLKDKNNG